MIAQLASSCAYCGIPISSDHGRRYCSVEHRKAAELAKRHVLRTCKSCGAELPSGRVRFCSDACRGRDYRSRHPQYVTAIRERARRWATLHRNTRGYNIWLRGPPPYVGTLPGGVCQIDIAPDPQWPVALRNARALHGVLTSLLGNPHSRFPAWTLRQDASTRSGWAVHWIDPDGLALSGRAHPVSLFNEDRVLYLSNARPVPAPRIERRGHRLIRVDAVSPVVIQTADRTISRAVPEASHIVSTLHVVLAARLGLSISKEEICIRLEHRETAQEWTDCGGKYGSVPGFVGHMVLDCNAAAAWLLYAAQALGLGGRCAFGFGQIAVTEVAR